jgi:hypothetical protein
VQSWAWPNSWQQEAIEAVRPHVDSDAELDILLGEPERSIHGTRIAGYLFTADDGSLQMIHDHSGRPGVHPWRLLAGPVLIAKLREPEGRWRTIYRHPRWARPD